MGSFLYQIRKGRTLLLGFAEIAKQKDVLLEPLQVAYMSKVGDTSTITSSGHFMNKGKKSTTIFLSVIFAIENSKGMIIWQLI